MAITLSKLCSVTSSNNRNSLYPALTKTPSRCPNSRLIVANIVSRSLRLLTSARTARLPDPSVFLAACSDPSFKPQMATRKIDESRMVQFLALALQLPADHPDRKKYYSMKLRQTEFESSDVAEITLMSPGDILVLYTDGVYDGSDKQARQLLEAVLREHYQQPAKDICKALLDYAVKQDDQLQENGDEALIDDKTVFIVKRT